MTSIDHSCNHYLVVDQMENINKTKLLETKSEIMLNVRKLTPRECGRLMGVKDADIDLLKEHLTDSELFHCFGDSICCNVLMAIFSQMLDISWLDKFKEIENAYIKELK